MSLTPTSDLTKATDEELVNGTVDWYDKLAIRANSELIRRQIIEMRKSNEITEKFNKLSVKVNRGMLLFTVVLLFIGIVQIIVTIITSNLSKNSKSWLSLAAMGVVVLVMYLLDSEERKTDKEEKKKVD